MIKIEISGEHPLEALASLTAYAMYCMDNPSVAEAANRLVDSAQNKTQEVSQSPAPAVNQTPPPAATSIVAQTAPAPTAVTVPSVPTTPPPVQPPVAPPPTYTYEQIGKAGADLVASNPSIMPTLMELLKRYGATMVTDLKPEQLGPFATELRGLGAKL